MRFSAAALVAALPALSAAQENPLDQYVAQFQQVLGQVSSYIPTPAKYDAAAAEESKTGPLKLSVLGQHNWEETLYAPVTAGAKTPRSGRCDQVEAAFTGAAAKFADLPTTPHMGILNCDDQPILCNAWAAGVGSIWAIEMLPKPAPIDIYKKRLNLTTVTTDEIVQLQEAGTKEEFTLLESFWHPFNGKAAELGLSIPLGYLLWAFNLVPQWAFMLIVSFASRSMIGNRARQGAAARAPAAAPK
ncbi:hypothetical protein TrVFT333_005001 [Trichoderma virens FT-333]|nr:hypothetical protein TrVFT333_005001 [Trichoderma virens FT-333]